MTMTANANDDVFVLDGELLHTAPVTGSWFMRPIEAVAAVLLAMMIGLLLLGVTSRYALHLPIVWIDETASLCFLWFAMLGAAIAIDRSEHLRLTLFLNMFPNVFWATSIPWHWCWWRHFLQQLSSPQWNTPSRNGWSRLRR